MIVRDASRTSRVLHEHTLPPRSCVPASLSHRHQPLGREDSDRFHLLNGQRAFRYPAS